jgi:hypothetical protein
MDMELLKYGTTFLIGTSSDSKWILNKNSRSLLGFEIQ